MFFGTLAANRVLQFVFASLTLLFALLAVGNITGNHALLTFAGYEGIICGASAIYGDGRSAQRAIRPHRAADWRAGSGPRRGLAGHGIIALPDEKALQCSNADQLRIG